MSRFSNTPAQKGFTLIELLVVVSIIAVLSAIILPRLTGAADDAQIAANQASINGLENALERYRLDNFNYPTTEQGLEALVNKPSGSPEPKNWKQYIKELKPDPWGNPYNYQYPGEHGDFDIFSLGADGIQGGEGKNADVGNWAAE